MLYAFLTAISSSLPMVTLAATPTATITPSGTVAVTVAVTSVTTPIPAPMSTLPPLDISIVNGNGWEIASVAIAFLGVIATFILGIAAIRANNKANEIAQKQMKNEEEVQAIDSKMTQQQYEREIKMRDLEVKVAKQQLDFEQEMRQREIKISVMDKAFEVYKYFIKEINERGFFNFTDDVQMQKSIRRHMEVFFLSKMLFSNANLNGLLYLFEIVNEVMENKDFPSMQKLGEFYKKLEISAKCDFTTYCKNCNFDSTKHPRHFIMSMIIKDMAGTFFEKFRLNL